ncbi:MAG: M23 family metallopeptidase [Bauldia sp.]
MAKGAVDLGDDPPLTPADKTDKTPVRRAVSLRWLYGTVLTGFTSTFLMGGALFAALSGRQDIVSPTLTSLAPPQTIGPGIGQGGKGDRLRPIVAQVSNRQAVQVSTISRQGDHDLIKLRPFAKISATLSTEKTFAAKIPAYDPVKIFAGTNAGDDFDPGPGEATNQIYGAKVDGEVTIKVTDLPLDGRAVDPFAEFKAAEVEQIVRGAAGLVVVNNVRGGTLAFDAGPEKVREQTAGPGVSIVPENVTQLAKTAGAGSAAAPTPDDRIALVETGQTFRVLLQKNSIIDDDADDIFAALSPHVDLARLKPGQKIRIGYSPADIDGGTKRPVRVSLYSTDNVHQVTVARTDSDAFVRANEPSGLPSIALAGPTDNYGPMPRVYDAIYETALEQQVPLPLVQDLIKIFSYEVDFQNRISPGDTIEIFHSLPSPDGAEIAEEGILYASITLNGVTKRFYRFKSPDDGVVDYYDGAGNSAKKFLVRKPISEGEFSSGFGTRRHPVLGYVRQHTGVDWAAPRGTPIMAAGDGVIETIGPSSGYGNFILLKHANGYETGYGHQSAFAKGMAQGVRVRQGQIIGYVGSTGLSTGPHVHFEIRINGNFVDPLRIRLPQGRVLAGSILQGFGKERDRIDTLMGHAPAATAKVAAR